MEEDDRYSNKQGTSKFKEIIEEERKSHLNVVPRKKENKY